MALHVKHSSISGSGVYTDSSIAKGSVVHTLSGENVSLMQLIWRMLTGRIRTVDDPLAVSTFRYLLADDFSLRFNHSCDPNCGIAGISDLLAIRDIEPGDEVTFDYSTTVKAYLFWWKMPCRCGATRCRKVVRTISYVPDDVYFEYLALGVLPKFVQDGRKRPH